MKKLHLLGAVCACFLVLVYQPVTASMVPLDGEIHLSLNTNFNPATDTTGTVATGIFDLYVIGDNFTDTSGILGYEWSLSSPHLGISYVVLTFTPAGPGPTNIGTRTNVIAATGGVVDNTGPVILGTYQLLAFTTLVDELLTLGPSVPSSVDGGPAWVNGELALYQFGFSSNLLLNQDLLPTPPGSPPAIPVPPALWLFGSGLLGLVGMARRKKAA